MRYTDKAWGAKTHQVEDTHTNGADLDTLQGEERAKFVGELMVEVQGLLKETAPLFQRWNGISTLPGVVSIILSTTSTRYILPKDGAHERPQSSPLGTLSLLRDKLNVLALAFSTDEGLAGIFPRLIDQINACALEIWENNKKVSQQRYLTEREAKAAIAPH